MTEKMSVKKCVKCGKEVDVNNGGCAWLMAFCRNYATTLTNVAICKDCYNKYVDADLRKINESVNLGIIFDRSEEQT